MRVLITLKAGMVLELPVSSEEEFEKIVSDLTGMKKFLAWDKRVWIRKQEIVSMEMVYETFNQ
jgi:hypothetical protein